MGVLADFEIVGGTITGREHTRVGKNNQDAYYWCATESMIVAVVSDGCSTGTRSEVGANLGARLTVGMLIQRLTNISELNQAQFLRSDFFWEKIRQDVLAQLRVLANALGISLSQTVNDFFLFTIMGVIVTHFTTFLFSIGDGIYYVNGELTRLGPFPNNEPPYLCYALTGSNLTDSHPELLKFWLHQVATADVSTILIGTDGVGDLVSIAERNMPGKSELVGPLSQFWEQDGYFKNQDKIRRKLSLINTDSIKMRNGALVREVGLLPDDTTMVVIRCKPKIL